MTHVCGARFGEWNRGPLESYLVDITENVVAARDPETGNPLVEVIGAAPADVRKSLARIARGDLGRVHMPDLEAVAARASRDIERLTGGVTSAALLISGSLLGTTSGWHRWIGDVLLGVGIVSTLVVAIGAWRRSRAP